MTWMYTAAIVLLALGAGIALRRVLLKAAARFRRNERLLAQITATCARLAPLLVPTAVAAVVVRITPLQGYWTVLLARALPILIVVCIVWTLLRLIGLVERSILRRHVIDVSDNLQARRIHTQTRTLARIAMVVVVILGTAVCLMMIPGMRQLGTGLLASAGVAGLVIGLAAQPILGNLIAGLQLALTQPIRLDDVVIVEGEWGRIEEITSTYVVIAIWDQRRLVVPLRWFIETPFQNWTRSTAQILGTVFLWLDYRAPVAAIRAEFERICQQSPSWDGRVCVVQVTETGEWSMQVRLLVSAADSGRAFELRCEVREKILAYLQAEYPQALPVLRTRGEERAQPVGS